MEDRRPAEAPDDEDVVELLIRQHGMIHDLFDEVRAAPADARREPFERLVRMLAVHEVAEEIVVHPLARTAVPGGDEVVADRLAEEDASKRLLSRLEQLDPDDPGFLPALDELRLAVLAHARAEERYEFLKLADEVDATTRGQLGKAVKAAEAVAPTHPHPGVDTAAENLVAGPVAAVMDRVRDAMRRATSHT
jgi:hemerythrin superfamily protein